MDPAEQEETVQNPDIGRPVGKEVSDVFYSVVGRDLRKRRRLSHALNGLVVRRIHVEESPLCPEESSLCLEDDLSNVDGEISIRRKCSCSTNFPGQLYQTNFYLSDRAEL